MGSFKRLQYICKTLETYYTELISPKASTLFINYVEARDLKNINLPNIGYLSPLKKQQYEAKELGFEIPNNDKKKYEIVITSIPKSREEALGQVARAYKNTKFGGVLVLEGNKRNGIGSIIKILSKIVQIDYQTSKAHGKIAIIKVVSRRIGTFSTWLDFSMPSKNKDGFFSMPGLFSYKNIDPASQFLSLSFNDNLNGNVIDLGSGWGFLSSKLLKNCRNVKSVTLLDHDQRALECAKTNINNPKAKFKWADINETTALGIKFDNAICNPPFHNNKGKNIELGKSFIKAAHNNLKSRGSLLLVANIQLPYENTIRNLFHNFQIHSENKYFKIILANKPKRKYDHALV
ncbi:MAG: methyltransferase [Paracoccaceae bacterium]|nr:methyltransferase [Paracoccaceae bacterium]